MRLALNFFPPFRRTSGRITHYSADGLYGRLKLPLTWRNRGKAGVMFGGSIYGAVDPIYVVMYTNMLGKELYIWDKSAKIEFLKPGRSTLYADFHISEDEIALMQQEVQENGKSYRDYTVNLVDKQGVVHARVEKTLYFKRKPPH